jgi:uncharacterized protein (DUF488 family)
MKIYTIGVYNSTEEEFFKKLTQNKIDTFCDIRQKRGVRGAKYSFVNSVKLQKKLDDLGINYLYLEDLAPSDEVRAVQKNIDKETGVQQRERQELDKSFIREYEKKVLKKFDAKKFIEDLNKSGARQIAFFCVEEYHTACHRSIIAESLHKEYNLELKHL